MHAAILRRCRVERYPYPDNRSAWFDIEVCVVLMPRFLAPAAGWLQKGHILKEDHVAGSDESPYNIKQLRMVSHGVETRVVVNEPHELANHVEPSGAVEFSQFVCGRGLEIDLSSLGLHQESFQPVDSGTNLGIVEYTTNGNVAVGHITLARCVIHIA